MSKQNSFITTSKIYFASLSEDLKESSYIKDGASLIIKIAVDDPRVRIESYEDVVQPENGQSPKVTLVTKIKTIDSNSIISTEPTVSDSSITVSSSGTEEVIDDTMDKVTYYVTTITSIVEKSGSNEEVFVSTETNDVTPLPEPTYRYLILNQKLIDSYLHGNPGGDYNMTCQELYSIFNIVCIKISEGLYQTLRPYWVGEKIIELDADTAHYGTTFFSEIRTVAKIWEARTIWYGEKTPTEITPEIVLMITTVMKAFATEIIYNEYDRRFLLLKGGNDLESASWHIQKHEAKEWLDNQGQNGSKTPFLDYLSIEKGMDKTELSIKILQKSEEFEDKLSTLLVEMHTLLKKFEICDNVWDLNILYEDYFGISMPIRQAISLGRTISEDDVTRKPEWRVKGNGYYF